MAKGSSRFINFLLQFLNGFVEVLTGGSKNKFQAPFYSALWKEALFGMV
jgi:hypothetical protein